MYICEDCGRVYGTLKTEAGCAMDEIIYSLTCPDCGGMLAASTNCSLCGAVIPNVTGSQAVCDDCIKEHSGFETVTEYAKSLREEHAAFDTVKINPFFTMFFDERDINRILWEALSRHTAHYTKKSLNGYAADFVSGDKGDFEEWLAERKEER